MNIFFLDMNPYLAAEMQCDKHVVKMILESAQLLCTAHHILGTDLDKEILYRKTHENHPCSKWIRESSGNYNWLHSHFHGLLVEYWYRYGKKHASTRLLKPLHEFPHYESQVLGEMTRPALAMPDEFKCDDYVEAYRNYYVSKNSQMKMAWTIQEKPEWFINKVEQNAILHVS